MGYARLRAGRNFEPKEHLTLGRTIARADTPACHTLAVPYGSHLVPIPPGPDPGHGP
jgi:hypothetical protein